MSDWPVGLSTGCFYRTSIFDCLEVIRSSGFGMVEICSYPDHLNYHDKDAVRRAAQLMDRLGLEAFSFHAPFADHIDITASDPARRAAAEREILEAADAAAILGVRYFVIHPGPEESDLGEHDRFVCLENAASSRAAGPPAVSWCWSP